MFAHQKTKSFRPDRSLLGAFYRLLDAGCIVLSLIIVSLFSPYPWYDPQWYSAYLMVLAVTLSLFFLVAEYQGLYLAARGIELKQELARIGWVWFTVIFVLLLLAYVFKISADYPRRVIILWFFATPMWIILWRGVFSSVLLHSRKRSGQLQNIAVWGAKPISQRLFKHICQSNHADDSKIQVYGDGCVPDDLVNAGGRAELIQAATEGYFEIVYLLLSKESESSMETLVSALADTPVTVYVIPDVFISDLLHARWVSMNGVPAINVFESPFYGLDGSIKRLTDIVLSVLFLMLMALPLLWISLAIKRSSPGPIIYKQKRYGLDGREIVIWKFRTMTVCENDGAFIQATRDDPRVTSVGTFLRRYSLDELPQFINVLQGSMSIVGPRPHPVALNEQHRHLIRGYMLRHRVKPGITGLAQVKGWRGETEKLEKMEKRIEYDLTYIRTWTLWLDFKIMSCTLFVVFKPENVY